jgi:hypothetical protein
MADRPDWSWWKKEDTERIYDFLRDQLRAINKLPYKRRAKVIHHVIRCTSCEDVVIQVIELRLPTNQPVRVMRYRAPQLNPLPGDVGPGERARAMAQKRSFRLGEWKFYIITDDEPDPPRTAYVFTVCACGRHTFTEPGILGREGPTSTNTPTKGH